MCIFIASDIVLSYGMWFYSMMMMLCYNNSCSDTSYQIPARSMILRLLWVSSGQIPVAHLICKVGHPANRAQQSRERDKMPFLPCILPNFNHPAYCVPGLLDHHQASFFFANTHVPYTYILSLCYWKRRETAHIVFVLESCSPPIHSPPSLTLFCSPMVIVSDSQVKFMFTLA